MAKTLFTTKKALEARNTELEAQNKALLAEVEKLRNAKKAPIYKEDTMARKNEGFKMNKRHEKMMENILNGGVSTTSDKEFVEYLRKDAHITTIVIEDTFDGKYKLYFANSAAVIPSSTPKGAPSDEEEIKELRIWEYKGKVDFTKATLKVLLPYFEPKKYDGFYRWGNMKHDGYNQKSYVGRRKAFCVYMATDGKYWDKDKAKKNGFDFSNASDKDSKWQRAKKIFEEKFSYVKKEDRQ